MNNTILFAKRTILRLYQLFNYPFCKKNRVFGDVFKISPSDGMEYFFGYYDISPWDISNRYVLCLRVKNTYKSVAPAEPAEIVVFDTHDNNSMRVLAVTNSWNVQQGCMLQWLGPDFSGKIIYNDFRNNRYCSIILDIFSNKESIFERPIYSVSKDGKFALTLDFSRLHRLRKGYGYSNIMDETIDQKCPDSTCIWHINLCDGAISPLLKYTDFANFEPRVEMLNAEHKINHIMLNPTGSRFMVLHRWFKGSKKYTRLLTVNSDGSDIYNLSDDDMISHCYWKDDIEILTYANKKNFGNGYFLLRDKSLIFDRMWPQLKNDGHPSYSKNNNKIITDSYPDRSRMSVLYFIENDVVRTIAKVYAPLKYENEVRCDLHPRWDRLGNKVCFDAAFEGKRALYYVKI